MPYFSLRDSSRKLNVTGSVGSTSQLSNFGNAVNDVVIVTSGSSQAWATDNTNPFVSRWTGSAWATEGPFRVTGTTSATPATSTSKTLPTARVSNLGNWPIWIVRGRLFLSGNNASRTATMTVQLPGQSLFTSSPFTIASEGTADRAFVADWVALDGRFSSSSQATGATFGFTSNGAYFYGRSSGTAAGTTDLPNFWGLYEYYEVPVAPTILSGTNGISVSGSSLTVTWDAILDWGGDTSTNSYLVQISSSSNFNSIHEQRFRAAGPVRSETFTGLANGTWYARVFAYNSIRLNFSNAPMSVASATRSATINVINTYTVTLDGTDQQVVIGQSLTLPSSTPPLGSTFVGWFTASTGGSFVGSAGSSYTPTANITLFPRYQTNTFTINYNANGGTGTTASTSWTYPASSGFVAFNAFSRTGFIFVGWGTSAGATTTSFQPGSTYFGSTTTSSGSVTLFAIWTEAQPVFSDVSITNTGILGRNISLNPDRRVSATPVQSYSIVYAGAGLNPTGWLSINSSGDLSGIPDRIGLHTFVVRANNGVGKDQDSPIISITISPAGKRFTPSPVQLSTAKRWQAGSGFVDLTIMRRFVGIGQPGADANGWVSISS